MNLKSGDTISFTQIIEIDQDSFHSLEVETLEGIIVSIPDAADSIASYA